MFGKVLSFASKIFSLLERVNADQRKFMIAKALVALAVFLYFFSIVSTSLDPDFGWHIKVGEWVLQNRQPPRYDELSHTMAGQEWVDHEWIMNAALALAYGNSFGWLIVVLFSAMAAAPFVYWTARARSYASFFPLIFGAMALSGFVFVRPAVFSFFAFFIFFEFLRNNFGRAALRNSRFFAFTVAFIWVWANLHAGFTAGLALLCLFVFFTHAQKFVTSKVFDFKALVFDSLLVLCCFLAPLANPYGIGLYEEVLLIMRSSEVFKYIEEWQPALFCDNWMVPVFYVPFVFFALLFRKKISGRDIFIASAFFVLFLGSIRNFMQFLVVALPVMAESSEIIRAQSKKIRSDIPMVRKTRDVLAWAVLAAFLFVISANIYDIFSCGQTQYYPKKAVEVLSGYAKDHRVILFNEYGWGGYLALKVPEIPVFIDGRMPHWRDASGYSLMEDYTKITYFGDSKEVVRVFERYGVNTALIDNFPVTREGQNLNENSPVKFFPAVPVVNFLVKKLENGQGWAGIEKALDDHGWRVLYRDDIAVLMVAPPGN